MRIWKLAGTVCLVTIVAGCGGGDKPLSQSQNTDPPTDNNQNTVVVSAICRVESSDSGQVNMSAAVPTEVANNLSNISGLAVYQGKAYVATGATLVHFAIADPSVKTVLYDAAASLHANAVFTSLRVHDNFLYATVRNTVTATDGSVIRFDLANNGNRDNNFNISGLNNPVAMVVQGSSIIIAEHTKVTQWYFNNTRRTYYQDSVTPGNFNPLGLDTDGRYIYATHSNQLLTLQFSGDTSLANLVSTTPLPAAAEHLQIYGLYAYVSLPSIYKVHRVSLTTASDATFEDRSTANASPGPLAFFNDTFLYATANLNSLWARPVNPAFSQAFTASSNAGVVTYTLDSNLLINNNWEEVGLMHGKVVLDGNSKTITITSLNTPTLFFGGGNSLTTQLEIKNTNIVANTNVMSALLRTYGHVKLSNVHLVLRGNVLNNGGGLAYNNLGYGTYDGIDIEVNASSATVLGKIGATAGPLLGYFSSGAAANITNSYTMVLDATSTNSPYTLEQSAGAFVGSGVGSNNTVTISNSYVVFNGSMSYGSGLVAGKFLGSYGTVSLNKFYAAANITWVVLGTDPPSPMQQPYWLSHYGGGSLFNSLATSDVNIWNLSNRTLNVYGETNSATPSQAGVTVHTAYAPFAAAAHADNVRVGSSTYQLLQDINGVTTPYLLYAHGTRNPGNVKVGSSTCRLEPPD